MVRLVQTLMSASSKLNQSKCHTTSAVQIALALKNSTLIKGVTKDVRAFKCLFQSIFGVQSQSLAACVGNRENIDFDLSKSFIVRKL